MKHLRYRFTLIELIISMGILMAVTGIIAMASKSFYDGYERSAKVTRRLKEYMAIDNVMDVHIRNLIPFQWNDENGNYRFVFSGEEHKLHFTTLRRSYGNRPGSLIFIRLFVEENKLIAEYATTPDCRGKRMKRKPCHTPGRSSPKMSKR